MRCLHVFETPPRARTMNGPLETEHKCELLLGRSHEAVALRGALQEEFGGSLMTIGEWCPALEKGDWGRCPKYER